MAEPAPSPKGRKAPSPAPGGASNPQAGGERGLRGLWQGPLLLVSIGLLLAAAVAAWKARPGYDVGSALREAEELVQRGDGAFALERLNGELLRSIDGSGVSPEHKAMFHLLRGDALHMAQQEQDLVTEVNRELVLAEYEQAERIGAVMSEGRSARIVENLIHVGRLQDAERRLVSDPPEDPAMRRALQRMLVESALERLRAERSLRKAVGHSAEQEAHASKADEDAHGHAGAGHAAPAPTPGAHADSAGPTGSLANVLRMLDEFLDDPALPRDDRTWAVARQGELRLDAGYPGAAIDGLLKAIPLIDRLSGPQAGELFAVLGRAYFERGEIGEAEKRLLLAEETLPAGDLRRATVQVLLGRIAASRGEQDEARERFAAAVAEFTGTDDSPSALLGLAEAEAALGAVDRAVEAYDRLIDLLHTARSSPRGEGAAAKAARVEAISSLRDRTVERQAEGDYDGSLRYARLAERLAEPEQPPSWVLLSIAAAHRDRGMAALSTLPTNADGNVDWSHVDPVTRASVRRAFAIAGDYYLRHAKTMTLEDDLASGESLWLAADCFDLAGETDLALRAFGEYAAGRPTDARRYSALFRLARAHQSRGDHAVAAGIFRDLVRADPPSGERFRSIVPLARSLLNDGEPANDSEAERLLEDAVGGLMPPGAPDFRLALNELGGLYYRSGRHPRAIERLTESLERFPTAPDAPLVRYMLADALRLSAVDIGETLKQALPQGQRAELEALRAERLQEAFVLYERICEEGTERDPATLGELDRVALRNAFFYRADCAFDLGRFKEAIDLYDAAANRYAEDPASLVAMIQIVNIYTEEGRLAEAETANERARQRLRELPPEAFERKDLPLERRHWERWLDSASVLARTGETGGPE